jgi:xanthine dehydrogenase molybdopterin-binding subunit B
VALEELKWGDAAHKWIPPGCLYTCGPGSYKIPSMNDVPFKFNVALLKVHSTDSFSITFVKRCAGVGMGVGLHPDVPNN